MKLFLVHCGFYDSEVAGGIYESHVNYFVVARDFDEAKSKIKENADFKTKKMHIDGLQQVDAVDGYRVTCESESALAGQSVLVNYKHRQLA